jgi:hypothetical protein
MSGFNNTPVGGNGKLITPAIKSPNYSPGVSGWAINKDGSAEFRDVVLPADAVGNTVTFSATAPANPNVGDVWIQV